MLLQFKKANKQRPCPCMSALHFGERVLISDYRRFGRIALVSGRRRISVNTRTFCQDASVVRQGLCLLTTLHLLALRNCWDAVPLIFYDTAGVVWLICPAVCLTGPSFFMGSGFRTRSHEPASTSVDPIYPQPMQNTKQRLVIRDRRDGVTQTISDASILQENMKIHLP